MQREFFQDEVGPMAAIVFVDCSLAEAAAPLTPAGGAAPRRPVVLGGRRVKTVDVHAHCAVPEAMALMGSTVSPQALLMVQEPVHERMRKMDAQGLDVEALSICWTAWSRACRPHRSSCWSIIALNTSTAGAVRPPTRNSGSTRCPRPVPAHRSLSS